MNERPIPDAAREDPNAVEMLRVWIAGNGLHCSIKVGMYQEIGKVSEQKAWGIILADIARHLARALSRDRSTDAAEELRLIRQSLLTELAAPTSGVTGDFTGGA